MNAPTYALTQNYTHVVTIFHNGAHRTVKFDNHWLQMVHFQRSSMLIARNYETGRMKALWFRVQEDAIILERLIHKFSKGGYKFRPRKMVKN